MASSSIHSLTLFACLWSSWGASCLEEPACQRPDEPLPAGDEEALHLLQRGFRREAVLSEVPASPAPSGICEIGARVLCPGSEEAYCSGAQCCPGTEASGNKSFPCPSAPVEQSWTLECGTGIKVSNCAPCLCSFDLDRTLTGRQRGAWGDCPADKELLHVEDTAYDGGNLTLSPVAQALHDNFCGKYGCFMAVVTAGDGSGLQSEERQIVQRLYRDSGGRLPSDRWCGPSKDGENRANCSGVEINSTLVAGCDDRTKQFAVEGMVAWLEETQNVKLPLSSVWHFDDKSINIEGFQGTTMNAQEISCTSRDVGSFKGSGLCGGLPEEFLDVVGVRRCDDDASEGSGDGGPAGASA